MNRDNWLDLKLMLYRQPAVAALLGIIVVLGGLLLMQPPARPVSPVAASVDPARVLAAQRNFRALLLAPDALAGAQQSVLAAAAAHHLGVGQIDYAEEPDQAGRFTLASMRLPVVGSYADIRAFVDAVLAAQPALAIRHLNIQRETNGAGVFALNATLTVQFLVAETSR